MKRMMNSGENILQVLNIRQVNARLWKFEFYSWFHTTQMCSKTALHPFTTSLIAACKTSLSSFNCSRNKDLFFCCSKESMPSSWWISCCSSSLMGSIVADVEEKPVISDVDICSQTRIDADSNPCLLVISLQCWQYICEQKELTFLYVVEQPQTGLCREMSVSVLWTA